MALKLAFVAGRESMDVCWDVVRAVGGGSNAGGALRQDSQLIIDVLELRSGTTEPGIWSDEEMRGVKGYR